MVEEDRNEVNCFKNSVCSDNLWNWDNGFIFVCSKTRPISYHGIESDCRNRRERRRAKEEAKRLRRERLREVGFSDEEIEGIF